MYFVLVVSQKEVQSSWKLMKDLEKDGSNYIHAYTHTYTEITLIIK